jgi:glycogen synthase
MPLDLSSWLDVPAVDTTEPVILVVGRLDRVKSPETVVQAAGLLNDLRDVKLVFVGRSNPYQSPLGDYAAWLAELSRELGVDSTFVGPVERRDLPVIYAGARVVVVASRYETYSMVAAEAMASARPVVVSDATGIAERIRVTEPSWVVPVGSAAALAAALRPALESARWAGEAGKRARELIVSLSDPAEVAAERLRVYAEAAGGSAARHR